MIPTRNFLMLPVIIAVSHVLDAAPKNAGANKPAAPAPTPAPVVETGIPAPAVTAATPAQTSTAAAFQAAAVEYEIEDDVPLPVKRVGVRGRSAYPFGKMGVNQSFFVPVSDRMKEPWKTLTSLTSRMTRELWPKRFVTEKQSKTLGDGSKVDGVRVWRQPDGTGEVPAKRVKKAAAAAPTTAETQQPAEQQPATQA